VKKAYDNLVNRLKRLTAFDIFVILAVAVFLILIGIKFLTVRGLSLKGTVPLEVTFMCSKVPNEVTDQIKEEQDLLVNNFYFGKVKKVEVKPDKVEISDFEGNLISAESRIFSRVFITVETEAVEGTNGYQRGNVKINVNETYYLYSGKTKLNGIIVKIVQLR
jgi:hypothetical protein